MREKPVALFRWLQFGGKDVSVNISGVAKLVRLLKSFDPLCSGRQVLSLCDGLQCFGIQSGLGDESGLLLVMAHLRYEPTDLCGAGQKSFISDVQN